MGELAKSDEKIAVIGLGYVGLPLAVALSRTADTIGFDIDEARIEQLRQGRDATGELAQDDLADSNLGLTSDRSEIASRSVYIVTVPTPIDEANRPDLSAILMACEIIGPALATGAIVVFESTVYPGLTEDVCVAALEEASGKRCGEDFTIGYSPERINPGDRDHGVEHIIKVVAAQDAPTLKRLSALYGRITAAGVHEAPSIKVAEAAKVIENTQRDLNIALMNEVAKICDLLDIRTSEVLDAAATKWNFLRFQPGLVGGHCIGVDPYYLTAKAQDLGYQPEVILSGRRINDSMGAYVGQKIARLATGFGLPMQDVRIGLMGLTFKENVPDMRNSKVIDVIRELQDFGLQPMVHDPLVGPDAMGQNIDLDFRQLDAFRDLHMLIVAVPHRAYLDLGAAQLGGLMAHGGTLVDIKSAFDPKLLRADIGYWSL